MSDPFIETTEMGSVQLVDPIGRALALAVQDRAGRPACG
jgi:hypothetical protein